MEQIPDEESLVYDPRGHLDQLAREHLEASDRRRVRSCLKNAPSLLGPDETIVLVTDALDGDSDSDEPGLALITDERLLFVGEDHDGELIWSIDLDDKVRAEAVEVSADYGIADVDVSTSSENHILGCVGDLNWAKEIVAAVHGQYYTDEEPTLVSCPVCGHEMAGRNPTCPNCRVGVSTDGPIEADRVAPEPEYPPPPPSAGPVIDSKGQARCPYCAEPIQAEAIVCRWCQSDLDDDHVPTRLTHASGSPGGFGLNARDLARVIGFGVVVLVVSVAVRSHFAPYAAFCDGPLRAFGDSMHAVETKNCTFNETVVSIATTGIWIGGAALVLGGIAAVLGVLVGRD